MPLTETRFNRSWISVMSRVLLCLCVLTQDLPAFRH